jgi:uncharacterized damage-inducible protein DinB
VQPFVLADHLSASGHTLKPELPDLVAMTDAERDVSADLAQGLVESFAVNELMHQMVLAHLDPAAWRAQLPGRKTRTIAAVFVHVHNIRRKWIRLSAPHLGLPAALDRAQCTQKQAQSALAESAALCAEMLHGALHSPDGAFHRDGWSRPWPAGAAMVTYMISHEAHHRGQVCMLAHQLGFPLPVEAGAGMWAWEKLWKQCGFTGPR